MLHSEEFCISDYTGLFLRLPSYADAAPTAADRQRYLGIARALGCVARRLAFPVVNPILRDLSNMSKVFHLHASAGAGLEVPRSLVTTSASAAARFVAENSEGGVIYKGASARKTWVQAYEPTADSARLRYVAASPTLFQERIVGPDVRVHAVGQSCFAELIESDEVDYRGAAANRYAQVALPSAIRTACQRLVLRSGIPFLGIDFKLDRRTGRWVFLEANAMPCYQGYDRRANGAISSALIEYLAG